MFTTDEENGARGKGMLRQASTLSVFGLMETAGETFRNEDPDTRTTLMDEIRCLDQDNDGKVSSDELCNSLLRVSHKMRAKEQELVKTKRDKNFLMLSVGGLVLLVVLLTLAGYGTSTAAVRNNKDVTVEAGSSALFTMDHEAVATNTNEIQTTLPALAWVPNWVREHIKAITFTGVDNEGTVVFHKQVSSIVAHPEKSVSLTTTDGDTLSWNISNMKYIMIELANGITWRKPAGCEQCTVINVVENEEVSAAMDKFYETLDSKKQGRALELVDNSCTGATGGTSQCVDLYKWTFWTALSETERSAAITLGYTQGVWDMGGLTRSHTLLWSELSVDKQTAAGTLGCDEECWTTCSANGSSARRKLSGINCRDKYADIYWLDLSSDQKGWATTLGWTNVTWNGAGLSGNEGKSWEQLTEDQKAASLLLDECDDQCWSDCVSTCANTYANTMWSDLSAEKQTALSLLGYDQGIWDLGGYSPLSLYWDDMSTDQQAASVTLYDCGDSVCWNTMC